VRPSEKEAAWDRFIEDHTPLLLQVARSVARDRDLAMDAFAAVLEGLQEEDFRRLRAFDADGAASFPTWLAVVSRRLCHDLIRSRYGRRGGSASDDDLDHRGRLVDLVGSEVEIDRLVSRQPSPERAVRAAELSAALEHSLASLPPEDRLLLALRFDEDVPVREIRDVVGAPSVFHVYRRLKKVLGRVRADLEGNGIGGPKP
jgi:RNA polymerase sigma factor (sigma-70 family)